METKWTEAIHKTPQPEPGVLTERALAQAPQKSRRTVRPYAYGSLALAATLPVAFLLLPKPSTPPEPEPRVTLALAKQNPSFEKRSLGELRPVSSQPKVALSQQTSPRKQNKATRTCSLTLANSQDTKTELLRLQERPLAETSGFQERTVLEEGVQENEEPLLRLALRRNLSALSASYGERGVQLAFGKSKRLAELEGTSLTPLPDAPVYDNAQLKTTLARWADGSVEGSLVLANNTKERGALPKTYLAYVAAFDAKGTLVSTAQTELPGEGGTVRMKLGLAPTAQHYQVALYPKPSPPENEMIVAGYLVRYLAGEAPQPYTDQITLNKPQFYESNYYKTISANLSVSMAKRSDTAGYTVHGALFDEKGQLLSTDQAPLKSEISLGFGVTGQSAARYQLAVTAPAPQQQNTRLGELLVAQEPQHSFGLEPQTARGGTALSSSTFNLNLNLSPLVKLSEMPSKAPDASFTVVSITREKDGSLVLLPPPCPSPMEEIFKNPKLRDYTQIKLAPLVVAVLKAKGITEFVGKFIQASGKSESTLCLSRPAFEVTTVTVDKAEDISVTQPPMASFVVASVTTEGDGVLVLMPKLDQHPMEEVLKKPELRDYAQIKLTPSVVAALKAKGITEFVGKLIQASGKSESTLYLSLPAVAVTTVTVEKFEDFQIGLPHQDFLQKLRAAKDNQARYELLISPTFNEVLLAAAKRGDEATVIELVQWSWFGGPDEAAKGGNGVTWAAYCPIVEPVKALLERGVLAGVADASGNTGLHRTYRPEIAELLLKHKAPTETKNTDGETPLLSQTRQADRWLGRLGVVQALLAAGANPNAIDNQGRTPLMWAAKSGLPNFVEALLKKGANPKRKDKDGKTARDYIATWAWGHAPGLLTPEGAVQLQRDAEADRARVEQLLGGSTP